MNRRNVITGTVVFAAALVSGSCLAAQAAGPKVTFNLGFSGHVDCYSPFDLSNVPLSIKAIGTINGDGTAGLSQTLTAYYFLSAKSALTGRLGGPPTATADGAGTAQLKVLPPNGLSYVVEYPQTEYTVDVEVTDRSCQAQIIPRAKTAQQIYAIYASKAQFLCSTFAVEHTSCEVT